MPTASTDLITKEFDTGNIWYKGVKTLIFSRQTAKKDYNFSLFDQPHFLSGIQNVLFASKSVHIY